jgi:hypothetical protein
MQEFVTINEKNYFPSIMLAGAFGYTSDYIGKLAREEKVLGLQIGRQWFVEKNSLEVYLQKIAIEKQIQKDALSQLRKKERLAHERENQKSVSTVEKKYAHLIAASQALALVVCGLLVGGLGWVSFSEQLTTGTLTQGVSSTFEFAASHMIPSQGDLEDLTPSLEEKHLFAQVLGVQSRQEGNPVFFSEHTEGTAPESELRAEVPSGVFTTLPQQAVVVGTEKMTSEVGVLSAKSKKIQFSDEVRVAVDEKGQYYLEPLLRAEDSDVVPTESVSVLGGSASPENQN